MAKLLITGGCGFIGGNLIRLLADRAPGWEITVLDNERVGRREDLAGLPVARFIAGDIRDRDAVDAAMAGQQVVIHLAAQTGVMPSIDDPEFDCDVNIQGGLTLLRAAARHGVKRFVNASSSAPVGAREPPMHEELPPRPASPYGVSKLAMEGYCSAFYRTYGLDTVSLRFSNCYGPGSRNKSSVVALFIKKILAGETLTVYGDGGQTRDFIHVDDLCDAVWLAAAGTPRIEGDAFGEVYQVATGVETSVAELIDRLRAVAEPAGHALRVEYAPARAGEVVRNYSDISKFTAAFGYAPRIGLDDGLVGTWDYFLSQHRAG